MSVMDNLNFSFAANPGIQNNTSQQPCPYASSLASSASSSVSSVFSVDGLSSQSSISSANSSFDASWDSDARGSRCQGVTFANEPNQTCFLGGRGYGSKTVTENAVAPELRQHPRRTASNTACARQPPTLVRQSERRVSFVDNLVDSAAQIVEVIWPLSVISARGNSEQGCKGVLPLRSFIQETLRRSRTSYSTLQVALYYLILIKPRIPSQDGNMEQSHGQRCSRAMQCGRRMFLSALILASKYLQDRNYSARAWSKISGLSTTEINQNEMAFLLAVGWRIHISEPVFQRWTEIVLKYTPSSGGSSNGEGLTWRSIIPSLTPDLDTIEPEQPVRNTVVSIRDLLSPVGTPSPSGSPEFECGFPPSRWIQTPAGKSLTIPSVPCRPQLAARATIDVLPTAQVSPQTASSITPAASAVSFNSRAPSMSSTMRQVRSIHDQRTTLEHFAPVRFYSNKPVPPGSYPYGRRSSLARSSTSSPESMISDVPSLTSSQSSRSSRSSSISSVKSATCAPTLPRLVTQATRRCATNMKEARKQLVIASPIDELSHSGVYTASPEPMTALSVNDPSASIFKMDTSVDMTHEAAQSLCELAVGVPRSQPSSGPLTSISPNRVSRKRSRTGSNDMLLQHNVRHHLKSMNARENEDDSTPVLPDTRLADSFLVSQPPTAQFPSSYGLGGVKLPLPLSMPVDTMGSTKRSCCGRDAARFLWGMSHTSTDMVVE